MASGQDADYFWLVGLGMVGIGMWVQWARSPLLDNLSISSVH